MATAAQEIVWWRNVLEDKGLPYTGPTNLYSDSNSALKWATSEKGPCRRAKHIHVRYHYTRDLVIDGKIAVHHVCSEENDADLITKPLGKMQMN